MAMKRILVIGGYGNFGSFISRMLAREDDLQIIIAGRDKEKALAFASSIQSKNPPEAARVDINEALPESLAAIRPDIVIHTSGPYQSQGYHVASACIEQGCHYIDLADGRAFVAGITALDQKAKIRNVLVCSGASSVPCLTSALIDRYKPEFKCLTRIDYGIATAQLTNQGLATASAGLSYAGKPFETLIGGEMKKVYGWQDLSFRRYKGLGWRPMGNCDIPDLEIFPKRYPDLKTIRFQAGIELTVLHLGLWLLSWLVRLRMLPTLDGSAPQLLKISRLFDPFGRDNSGFYMKFSGAGENGKEKEIVFNITARHGDGLYIPSTPAIIMAKKLARGEIHERGAKPCVGLITLEEYLKALEEFDIEWSK